MKYPGILVPLAALVLLAVPTRSEDFMCSKDAGCTARINDGGVLKDVSFRKGDLVSTENGWVLSPDGGWEKVKKGKGSNQATGKRCWCGLVHRCKWCGEYHSTANASGRHTPTYAHQPPTIVMIGVAPRHPTPVVSPQFILYGRR